MALILENSVCPFCGKPLMDGRPYDAFPALFARDHAYAVCSDAGFHKECFEKWEHHETVVAIYQEYLSLNGSRPEIPEGMAFEDFIETEVYKAHARKIDELLGNEPNQ